VRHDVDEEIASKLMLDEIYYDEEHSGFYARLRELADMPGESSHHMKEVCDYIYWAD